MPFCPAPEFEVWVADAALFSFALWEQTAADDYFLGIPAIVIEVLSPRNSASEMIEREELCLAHGGKEFWLVDPQRETVKVIRSGGYATIRPAVIVSNNASNRTLNRIQVVPITTRTDRVYPCEAIVSLNGDARKAMADQITTVSKLRLSTRMGVLSESDLRFVDGVIRVQLGLNTAGR